MLPKEKVKKKTSIGGQALIEGIMMRGPEKTAMAVRHTSGEIVMESWKTAGSSRAKVWKLPFIRGVFNFIDSMAVGYRCLMRSAEMAGLDEEEPKPHKTPVEVLMTATDSGNATGVDAPVDDAAVSVTPVESVPATAPAAMVEPMETKTEAPAEKPVEGWFEKFGMTLIMVLGVMLGVVIAVGLFMTLPAFLFNRLRDLIPALDNSVYRAIIEGVMRIVLFVGYISAVSLMKDIRRVFMYHGAEHKTIFCYEKGQELTVENVRKQTRFHPRCGTSFLILMLIVGIVVSMFITVTNPLLRTGVKLLTVPLIVGIGYELIKIAGRSDHVLVRVISAPGLWLQRITTKEPTDDMIEVAIKAFRAVVPEDTNADRI